MIKLCATVGHPTFPQWKMVNDIIWPQIKDTEEWNDNGFEGIALITPELFGFRIIRNSKSTVEFIFDSDEDYVYFKLKNS
jgi:hypothetical protein